MDLRALTLFLGFCSSVCPDEVRLVGGLSRCSGRLQLQRQSDWEPVTDQNWDWNLTAADEVCRRISCGSVVSLGRTRDHKPTDNVVNKLKSGFKAEVTPEPPPFSVEITCTGRFRLVGGSGRCDGTLEMRNWDEWRPVAEPDWNLRWTSGVCRELDCGSPVSTRRRETGPKDTWGLESECIASSLIECVTRHETSSGVIELTCSDSVRLEYGTDLCSGRLQVKRNQVWSSVCSDGFDLQNTEVVCRELGCGSPSGFEGDHYGEAPEWSTEFRCGGHESALLHCERSDRDTCSPGTTVTLSCSDPDDVQLVGGASRCSGRLEMKHDGVWRAMKIQNPIWNLDVAALVCRRLDCGAAVSAVNRPKYPQQDAWWIGSNSPLYTLKECVTVNQEQISDSLEVTCSDSVMLVDGDHLCSGRLQVKRNQVWSSVCSDGFDLQDAEVVCRELGCGSPLGFEGDHYGEAPEWSTEFRCGGHESALLHCERSDRDTCSPGTTVTLTCSAPDRMRLVGNRTCTGELQMMVQGEWRPVMDLDWYQNKNQSRTSAAAATVCSQLGCGSVVATDVEDSGSYRPVWLIRTSFCQSAVSLQNCLVLFDGTHDTHSLQVVCSAPPMNLIPGLAVLLLGMVVLTTVLCI